MSADFAGLEGWWPNVLAEFERLRTDAHDRVQRWSWASGFANWEIPVPFFNESCGERPVTREFRHRPVGGENPQKYGWDVSGRIIATEFCIGEVTVEEFFHDFDGGVRSASFGRDGSGRVELRAASETRPNQHRAESYFWFAGSDGRGWSEMDWDGDRVRTIRSHVVVGSGEEDSEVLTPRYDEMGRLAWLISDTTVSFDDQDNRIRTKEDRVVYRRPVPGRAKRAQRVEDYLVEAVPGVVARLGVEEPLGYVVVLYVLAVGLPPMLGVETVSRRDAAPVDVEIEDLLFIADLAVSTDPDAFATPGPEVVSALQEINQAIRADDEAVLRRIAVRASKRLNGVDWPASVLLAEDFFVIAVDAEMTDPIRDAKASIPSKRRSWLKSRGLI